MPGFSDSLSNAQDLVFSKNADFSGAASPLMANGLQTNGQLWIGATIPNVGGTHINVGVIDSPLGTISVGYAGGNITLDTMGGSAAIEKINVQTGTSPIVPNSGVITINGAVVASGTHPVRTDGTGPNTLALEVQTSQALIGTDATKIGLSNFNSAQFTVDANGFVSSLGAMTDYHTARYIVSAGGATDGANYTTISTAYAAAVLAGAPQTVFIQPGTYTENLTLTAGINISAFTSDGFRDLAAATDAVIIIGKITMTTAGTVSIANIQLRTNSDYFLEVTGTAASIVYLDHCYLNCLNNTGIHSTSTSSEIRLINSGGNLATTGIAYFALSGGGNLKIQGGDYSNSGNSLTASTWSAGILTISYSEFDSFITSSGNGAGNIYDTFFNQAGNNTTIITHNSTGTGLSVWQSQVYSGTASAISIGAGASLNLYECEIASSNTNAIAGAGSINLADIVYISTSSKVSTTTQTLSPTNKGAFKIALPAGDYTVLTTDEIVGATSSGARAITLNASPSTGQVVTVKDITGTAAANNITITPAAGNIDGAGTKVIASNYGSVTLFYSGTAWFSI